LIAAIVLAATVITSAFISFDANASDNCEYQVNVAWGWDPIALESCPPVETNTSNTGSDCDYSDALAYGGWGWNPVTQESCEPLGNARQSSSSCDYSNAAFQDGWGWNAVTQQSCVPLGGENMGNGNTNTTQETDTCDYSNASSSEGWGWDAINNRSCEPLITDTQSSTCVDPDGDGWGWDGTSSCRTNTNNSGNNENESVRQSIERQASEINGAYGVWINYEYDPATYFPPHWLLSPILGRATQLTEDEVARVLPLTDQFLSAYPQTVLQNNLANIFLSEELNFYNQDFGGTYSNTAIYIANQGANRGYTDRFLLEVMHSEFSSILMMNYRFPWDAWRAANIDSFEYGGNGVEVLGQPDLFGQSEELLSQGFIVRYAQSSLENDFNMIARLLFTDLDGLLQLADDYPRLKAKVDLAIAFYESIEVGVALPVR